MAASLCRNSETGNSAMSFRRDPGFGLSRNDYTTRIRRVFGTEENIIENVTLANNQHKNDNIYKNFTV